MNTTENIISTPQVQNNIVKPVKFPPQPQEWKIVSLRECPTPADIQLCDTPEQAAAYWNLHITNHPYFNPENECLVVLILNVRRKIKGHYFVSVGTMDTILVHPREVFRLAIMASAHAIVVMHNLCVAAHKLCYVTFRVMCSARLMGLASPRFSRRRTCNGFA
ncbi:MAG TPA: JAB domain-containing protein [Candidatus Acidoferrales bacterium]|nr:JAB domain-containing protein [Candidatus Acidoferrales bacterium]